MIDPLLHLLCRAGIALLLLVAAGHKLGDPARFRSALRGYALLPDRVLPWAGAVFIATEVAVALGLLIQGVHRAAACGAFVLLSSYTLAIAWNLLRGRRDIDCGCVGPRRSRGLGWSLVARNVALLAAIAAVFVPVGSRALGAVDALTFTGALLVAALCTTAFASLGALPVLDREAHPVAVRPEDSVLAPRVLGRPAMPSRARSLEDRR